MNDKDKKTPEQLRFENDLASIASVPHEKQNFVDTLSKVLNKAYEGERK